MRATESAAALRPLLAKLVCVALVGGLAAPASAAVVSFRAGRLAIRVDLLGAQYSMWAPQIGLETGTVDVDRTATTLSSFTLPAGSFSVLGAMVPVADPGLQPITGLIGSFANEEGVFSRQSGTLGGEMGLSFPGYPTESAILEVCLLFPCSDVFVLMIPLAVVGTGGQETGESAGYSLTLTGAPWTIGSASVPIQGGQATESGSLTVLADGWMRVRLVTPIAIDWDGPDDPPTAIPAQVAAFGLLDLEIAPVPEPAAGGAGLASLASLATLSALARRRRRSQPAPTGRGTRSSRRSVPSAKVATR